MPDLLLACDELPSPHSYQHYLAECGYLLGWRGRLAQLHDELLSFTHTKRPDTPNHLRLGRQERLGGCLELLGQLDDCLLSHALQPLERQIEHFEESALRQEQDYLRQTIGQQWV